MFDVAVTSLTSHTPDNYNYNQFWLSVSGRWFMVFRVQACNDAHIGLAATAGNSENRLYEVVIGGNGNTQSFIRRTRLSSNEAVAETPDILNCNELRTFWIQWENNHVEVGEGSVLNEGRFINWYDTTDPHVITAMALSTGWGSTGDWQFSYINGGSTIYVPATQSTDYPTEQLQVHACGAMINV